MGRTSKLHILPLDAVVVHGQYQPATARRARIFCFFPPSDCPRCFSTTTFLLQFFAPTGERDATPVCGINYQCTCTKHKHLRRLQTIGKQSRHHHKASIDYSKLWKVLIRSPHRNSACFKMSWHRTYQQTALSEHFGMR